MNFAHIHLLLNHLPVIGLPIGLILLSYGLYKKDKFFQNFSLWGLVGLAITALPVYLTGESAEEVREEISIR